MARKKQVRTGNQVTQILFTLALVFSIVLGVMKIIWNKGSWLSVFYPVITVFLLILIFRLIKALINKV